MSPATVFPAFAEIQYEDYEDASCGSMTSTNVCFSGPSGSTVYGGQYTACTAKGSFKEGCWTVVEVPKKDGQLVRQCGKVAYSASCSCESTKLKTDGTCTYYR